MINYNFHHIDKYFTVYQLIYVCFLFLRIKMSMIPRIRHKKTSTVGASFLVAEKEGFIRFAVPCILPTLNCFAICRPLHHSALLSSSTGRSRARAHAPPGARFQILSHTKKQAPLVLVFWWRRRRDLNPRAGCPTYTLSRGASSPLEYFSKVKMCSYYSLLRGGLSLNPPPVKSLAERVGFEPTWACTQTVFKTASL